MTDGWQQKIGEVSVLDRERQVRAQLETGGLWPRDTGGPSVEDLRPYGPRITPGFPVYSDLEERLLKANGHPDPVIAHALAACAAYSYADTETLSMIMARMGLLQNNCRVFTSSVDPIFVQSTGYLVQSESGRVAILCYRGTEPMNFINWMVNADVEPERMRYAFGDPYATVHAGFYRNVRATRYQIMRALRHACRGESIRSPLPAEMDGAGAPRVEHELERLYITGHSLGGAMAAIMAVMLTHERKFRTETEENIADRLEAVYTFGQPMVGDPHLARASDGNDFLRKNMIRYVYDDDIIPHLPPMTSGRFSHFGREWRYQVPKLRNSVLDLSRLVGMDGNGPTGTWQEQRTPSPQALTVFGGFGMAVLNMLTRPIRLLRAVPWMYSFDDHRPNRYINALTPSGVPNEFGD